MILKQKVNTLTKSELLKLNRSLKQSCSFIFGDSGVRVRTFNKTNNIDIANYDPQTKTINIYRGMTKDVDSYVRVFIHEWTHSRQKNIKKKYLKYESKYGYWNNPYEVEARENEKKFKSIIWKLVKMCI